MIRIRGRAHQEGKGRALGSPEAPHVGARELGAALGGLRRPFNTALEFAVHGYAPLRPADCSRPGRPRALSRGRPDPIAYAIRRGPQFGGAAPPLPARASLSPAQ